MAWTRLVSNTRLWARPTRARTAIRPRPGVMFVHGNSQDEKVAITPAFFGQRRLIAAIADAGYVVMADQHHGAYAWSNDDSIEAMDAAHLALQDLPGVLPGPVHLVGVSMGNQQAMAWARRDPSKVASIVGIIPVVDVGFIYDNNIFGLRDTINAAYIHRPRRRYVTEVDGPTKDPWVFRDDVAPWAARVKLWYSTGDTIITPSRVLAFSASTGVQAVAVDGGEHSEEAVEATPRTDVIAWLRLHDFVAETEPEPPPGRPVRHLRLLTKTVTVVNRAAVERDAYGNDVVEEVDRYEVRSYHEQTSATEVQVDRDSVVSDHLLVLPAQSAIGPLDLVLIDAERYEVVGIPARPWNPRLRAEDHVEVRLRRSADAPAGVF